MLANVSIRAKIIGAFAMVLGCTIALGLFATQRLNAVNEASAQIRQDYLPSTRILGEIAYHTMRFRQLEATAGLAPDAEARGAEEVSMRRVQEQGAKAFEAYEPLVSGGEERRLADRLKQAWADYLSLDAQLVALLRADDVRDAVAAYLGAAAHFWILAVLAMMAALCVGIGWSLIRGISVPLRQMTGAMHRLAGGDMATEISATDRKDEVGQMAQAMVVFRQNALETRGLQAAAGARAEGTPSGGDGWAHAGLRHFGSWRDGEPRAFRGSHAPDRGGDVGRRASHARQRRTRRRWSDHVDNQPRRRIGRRGADVFQHQRDQPAGGACDPGGERGRGAGKCHRHEGRRHGGGGGSGR
jgi:HAMP domain-containing protein